MAKRITRYVQFANFVFLLFVFCAADAGSQTRNVILTPAVVEAGSPELIRVDAPAATSVEGNWLGKQIHFFRGKDRKSWYALAGVDVEAPAGESTLRISLHLGRESREISDPVLIHEAHYKTGSITVPPKFVEPDPEALKEIDAERALKMKIFTESETRSPDTPLWSGSFEAPVKLEHGIVMTDSFGTRRMFNGKLASIHKGADIRAATGTPVRAGNAGVVILAQHLYYEGNCVMIDHGMGLISLSMHLSKIDVKPGQQVARGELIGLSGATGRVTGPHLHWAIRWQGAMLDPAKLLRLDLNTLR